MTSEGFYEVTIRGTNAKRVEKYIQEISKKSVLISQVEDEVTEIELKFEAIYLKNVLDFYNKKNMGIHITYEKNIDMDEIFTLEAQTSIILTGRRQDIFNMADLIFSYIDNLIIFTLLITHTESKVIEANFLNFKNLIFPVEARLAKDKSINESPHPFFFYSREERKLIFLGTEQ